MQISVVLASVVDPDPVFHFDTDPDRAFHFEADSYPDPTFHSDADPDPTFQFDPYPDPTTCSPQILTLQCSKLPSKASTFSL
jgi:hypothetical protein